MSIKRFPDFGKAMQRPSPVHEYCYDCIELYHGCNGWPANRKFDCADGRRLPDVTQDAYGQVFPPSRMQDRKEPYARGEPIADSQGDSPISSPASDERRRTVSGAGPRLCGCGTALSKGKRLCESCRVERRRQSMREYMRSRRTTRQESEPVDDMPLFATARPPSPARSNDLSLAGLPSGGVCLE